MSKFTPEGQHTPGFIAELGTCAFAHCFGGSSWTADGPESELGAPVLLAVIDYRDPRLAVGPLRAFAFDLPLFSYINHDGLIASQEYEVDRQRNRVRFDTAPQGLHLLEAEDRLSVPLPESSLSLREMVPEEIPVDEATYWTACGSFLGGSAFFRCGGVPVFVDDTVSCGPEFVYSASIGYESYEAPGGYLGDEPFFMGELALYFFAGVDGSRVRVISQAS